MANLPPIVIFLAFLILFVLLGKKNIARELNSFNKKQIIAVVITLILCILIIWNPINESGFNQGTFIIVIAIGGLLIKLFKSKKSK